MLACQTCHRLPHRLPPNLSEFPRGNPYLARLAMYFEKVFRERRCRKFPQKPRLRISAIVDTCFRLIVDGVSEPSWTRRGCAQARG